MSLMCKIIFKEIFILFLKETFFGLGYTIGPLMGSFLYQIGGFQLPFLVVGGIGLVSGFTLIYSIPKVQAVQGQRPKIHLMQDKKSGTEAEQNQKQGNRVVQEMEEGKTSEASTGQLLTMNIALKVFM